MNTVTYDPISNTVTIDRPEFGDRLRYTFKEYYALCFAVQHLNYSGRFKNILSRSEIWQAYCLCDGFGKLSPRELKGINGGWDWSHIRDSSTEALVEVAEWIAARHWSGGSLDAIIAQHKADIDRLGKQGIVISLFDLVP